jgi:uroporphyrinogen-III synthase
MLVLITRAADEGARTANRLAVSGHDAILSPVLEMTPTGAQWPSGVVDGVLATSRQAFELFSGSPDWPLPEACRLLPLYMVGERTREAARERGFEGRALVAADAKDLASAVVDALADGPPSRLVYLAGRDRKPDLEAALKEVGHVVDAVEVYAAQPAEALSEEAASLIEAGEIGAVLHYSRRSADIFLALSREAGVNAASLAHVAISADAAHPLKAAGVSALHIAEQPNEQGMLGAVRIIAAQHFVDRETGAKP